MCAHVADGDHNVVALKPAGLEHHRVIGQVEHNVNSPIAACVADILSCILNDEHRVLAVSSYDHFSGTSFGFPSVVGRQGIIRRLDLQISEKEGIALQKSINALGKAIKSVKM